MISKISIRKFWGITICFFTFLFPQIIFANASQPGIWNAGGTIFTMLYPEDSLTFKKVQMQEERIYIQLYKGYSVVKGTYLFRNTTQEPLRFKMGYPVNGIYYGGENDQNTVTLDSLSRFNIKAKGDWLPLLKETHSKLKNDYHNLVPFNDNWMVWQMAFEPGESQTVEVYFIVNTNEARIQKGYNIEQRNAFIYLLESGSVWHQPIEKGHFYVQLMNGLTTKNIKGISPGFGFQFNEMNHLFAGTRTNFLPTPKDNLIITYHEYEEHFAFDEITIQTDSLYSKIDDLSQLPLDGLTFTQVELGDPYAVKSTLFAYFPALLTLFVLFAPFIIGIIILAIAIWAIVKWIKINKKKPNRV